MTSLETFFQWFGDRTDGQVTAVATTVIAIFTIVVAIVGYRQFRIRVYCNAPHIAVDPLGIHPMAAGRSVAHVSVRNAGNLPARHVSWLVTYTFGPRRIARLPELDMTTLRGDNVLAPGASMRQGSKSIKYPLIEADETGFLYVYGIVIYHDGFKAGRETRFCHRYNRENAIVDLDDTKTNGPRIRHEDARDYHEGNSAT